MISIKALSVVGARPQFIKLAAFAREFRKKHKDVLIHTGQHYDPNMSKVFFDELHIPKPDYNLDVGSGSHAYQTAEIMKRLEPIVLKEKPDVVIVYGDTNSTIAGAMTAAKLCIDVAHVEAGLRSFDRAMPEEVNRVLTDHLSRILFAPTKTAVKNLKCEGIERGVFEVGDVMYENLLFNRALAQKKSGALRRFNVFPKKYMLSTIHRPSNTDEKANLSSIIDAFIESGQTVVFPVHPRTVSFLNKYGLDKKIDAANKNQKANIIVTAPQGYLDFLNLMAGAKKILTDSGGIQKEAYMLGVPCVTLRENTEWVETVKEGWNVLVGSDKDKISRAIRGFNPSGRQKNIFGNARASAKMTSILEKVFS